LLLLEAWRKHQLGVLAFACSIRMGRAGLLCFGERHHFTASNYQWSPLAKAEVVRA
jgi:hypothetical protein